MLHEIIQGNTRLRIIISIDNLKIQLAKTEHTSEQTIESLISTLVSPLLKLLGKVLSPPNSFKRD